MVTGRGTTSGVLGLYPDVEMGDWVRGNQISHAPGVVLRSILWEMIDGGHEVVSESIYWCSWVMTFRLPNTTNVVLDDMKRVHGYSVSLNHLAETGYYGDALYLWLVSILYRYGDMPQAQDLYDRARQMMYGPRGLTKWGLPV